MRRIPAQKMKLKVGGRTIPPSDYEIRRATARRRPRLSFTQTLTVSRLIRPTVRKKIKKPTLRVLTLPHAPRCGYLPFPPSFSEQIRRIGKVSPAQAQWGGVQKVQQWKTMFGVVCVPPPAVNAWWTLSPALTKSSSCSFVPRTHSQEPSRRATTAPTARATLRWQRDVLACGCNGSRTRGS